MGELSGQARPLKRRTRRTRLTLGFIDAFAEILETGVWQETAIGAMAVPRSTFFTWLNRGREELDAGVPQKKQSLYAKLAVVVQNAYAVGEAELVRRIRKAGEDPRHWTANAWLLERRNPEAYALRQRVDVTMDVSIAFRIMGMARDELITYNEVAEEYGDDLAGQLFQAAGITLEETSEA